MPQPVIVVVEEEPCILQVYTELLQDEGYCVVRCAAKADAVSCIQREQPDVVVLNLWPLTEAGDWTIYQTLAEDSTAVTIRVIVCTTTDPAAIQPPGELHASPVAILHKPFPLDHLLDAVETALFSYHCSSARPS